MFVRWPALGNLTFNERTGGAVAAGVSLNAVSPGVVAGFHAIGAAVEVVDAIEAERHLMGAISSVRDGLAAHRARLQADLATLRDHLDAAGRLAALPMAGDEEAAIKGMLGGLDGALARALPNTRDVDHIAAVLDLIQGIRTDEIRKALSEVADERAGMAAARAGLEGLRAGFLEAIDKINDPATIEAVRAKKVSVRALRVMPVATEELRRVRADAVASLARLDSIIAQMEKAA
jgi:hypothetical protein